MISHHHNDLLVGHFGINKTRELVARNNFWHIFHQDVKAYVKGYNLCLVSKVLCHKLYKNLQSLSVPTHYWKDMSIDFVIDLLLLEDWKDNSYDTILVIINCLIKIVHYEPVITMIDVINLTKIIINIVVKHHSLMELIMSNWDLLFILK